MVVSSLFIHSRVTTMKIDKSRTDVDNQKQSSLSGLLALDGVPALAERSGPLPALFLGLVLLLLPLSQDLGVFGSSLK